MNKTLHTLTHRNIVATLTLFALLACLLASCGTTRNTGNGYQKHLSHKHTGGHYLNSNNRGCGWSNN